MFSALNDATRTLEVPSSASRFISASLKKRYINESELDEASKIRWFSFNTSSISIRLLSFAVSDNTPALTPDRRGDGGGFGGGEGAGGAEAVFR